MNVFDAMPDIPPCPHCGHNGDGLQWSFPDLQRAGLGWSQVQCACLACGAHGEVRPNYAEAVEAFAAGLQEQAA